MKRLKYIRFETRLTDSVFLFPACENHADVAHRLRYTPVSAGFVTIYVDDAHVLQVVTHGRSESLNMESDPADADLIRNMFKSD